MDIDRDATTYDACIVGAGPAGSAAAFLLAKQGLSVALVDRATFPRDKTCGDGITPRGARVLARMGALDAVARAGFACRGVDIRGRGARGEAVEFTMRFDRAKGGGPSDLTVLPRRALDDLLLRHALNERPTFVADTKVTGIDDPGPGRPLAIRTDAGATLRARLVVLATGAESQLLRACGLLDAKPPIEHAARAYFDGVDGLTDRVVLFFDGVDLPGYGWIFPTSSTSANIGCGVFAQDAVAAGMAKRPMPQAQRLEHLFATHPMLRRMLARATRREPIRAYPLRTDFRSGFAGRGRLLVVGEAAGLVNPITGEGIDYALESAEFLATAVRAHWRVDAHGALAADASVHLLDAYRTRLSRRFTRRFQLYRAMQRYAMTPERVPVLLTQVSRAAALQRLVVDGLFGQLKPAHLFKPAALWQIARIVVQGGATPAGATR